jgi:ribonuclease P protein component
VVQRPKTTTESKPTTTDNFGERTGPRSPARQRFGKAHRLPDAAAFSRVFADARRSRDRLFTVLSRRNGSETARLGLAIAKKHVKHATQRNRIRRIVRESFRRHRSTLAGLDLVVLAQSATPDADNDKLFDSLSKHWQNTRSAHLDDHGRRPSMDNMDNHG